MKYLEELNNVIDKAEVNLPKKGSVSLDRAIENVVDLLIACRKRENMVMFVGNGGSAAIASHIATDLLKNADIRAMAFNDSSLLTCISNDLGYENVFKKPIEILSKKGDILFAISSSGSSKNILNAANAARKRGCFVITLSGFKKDNRLRKLGDINFYAPSESYGYTEIVHSIICHCIVDILVKKRKKNG
jgi:D-sedoheptulose 7-phosphate isomerase